jgi:hypothetical protein
MSLEQLELAAVADPFAAKLLYGGINSNSYGFVPILWTPKIIFNGETLLAGGKVKLYHGGKRHRGVITRTLNAGAPFYEVTNVIEGATPTGLSHPAANSIRFNLATTKPANQIQGSVKLSGFTGFQLHPHLSYGGAFPAEIEIFFYRFNANKLSAINPTSLTVASCAIYYEFEELFP